MKSVFKVFGLFIVYSFLCFCFVSANDYEYKSLNISANILIDGTIDVSEDFVADFFVNKHGIIRDIPLNYSVGGYDFHINVSNVYVVGKNFTTSKNNGNIEVKIGDADRTVIGEQDYPISYSTYGLIRNFSGMGYAELYRNLVGYDFDTNINKVRVEIYLPKTYTGLTADDFLITTDGSTKTVQDFGGTIDWKNGNRITIIYNNRLPAYQGITLAIKFPNDYFEFDHKKQSKLIGKVSGGGFSFLNSGGDDRSFGKFMVVVVGLILFFGVFYKKDYGWKNEPQIRKSEIESDLKKEGPIVVMYSPPKGVSCAEAGMLYNCILEPTDLTSLLYKWIIDGLISVHMQKISDFDKPDGFIMTKLKNIDINNPSYEVKFFNYLFPGEINSKKMLSKSSDFEISDCLKDLRKYGWSKGWIKLGDIDEFSSFIGVLIGVVLFLFLLFIGVDFLTSIIGMLVVASFLGKKSHLPTQKRISLTSEGERLSREILGYAQFLKVCDENKLRLFLKQDPTFFDKTLPYAVAFGFETSFIRKITPILRELDIEPVRCDGDIYDMDCISSIVRSNVRSQEIKREIANRAKYDSSSGFSSGSSFSFGGGGGFSAGGGGGGGGGRSW